MNNYANNADMIVYIEVWEHAARTVGDLEGRRRGITTKHSSRFLESHGSSSVSK